MGSQQRFREEERLQSVGQQDHMTGRDISLKGGKDPTLGLGVEVAPRLRLSMRERISTLVS